MDKDHLNGHASTKGENGGKGQSSLEPSPPPEEDVSDNEMQTALPERGANGGSQKVLLSNKPSGNYLLDVFS